MTLQSIGSLARWNLVCHVPIARSAAATDTTRPSPRRPASRSDPVSRKRDGTRRDRLHAELPIRRRALRSCSRARLTRARTRWRYTYHQLMRARDMAAAVRCADRRAPSLCQAWRGVAYVAQKEFLPGFRLHHCVFVVHWTHRAVQTSDPVAQRR